MSPWFLKLKEFIEPVLVDLAISKLCKKMTKITHNQTIAKLAEKSANLFYKGPIDMMGDELSAFAEDVVSQISIFDEESDLLSFSIGKAASLGYFYLLSNSEIDGAIASAII